MLVLFLRVLALGIASAASPIILAISLSLLSRKEEPGRKLFFFFLGGAVVALMIALCASSLWGGLLPKNFLAEYKGQADFALGWLFIIFAFAQFLPQKKEEKVAKPRGVLRLFLLGFIVNATNFDAVLLNAAAVREVANSQAGLLYSIVLILLADAFFLSPALLPLAAYLVAPSRAETALEPIGAFLKRYGRYLVALVLFAFGAYLLLWR